MKTIFKIKFNKEWEEYRVQVFEDGILNKDKTYHTNDKHDAIDTMKAMKMLLVMNEKPVEEIMSKEETEKIFKRCEGASEERLKDYALQCQIHYTEYKVIATNYLMRKAIAETVLRQRKRKGI